MSFHNKSINYVECLSSNDDIVELHEIGFSLLIWIVFVYVMVSLLAHVDIMS